MGALAHVLEANGIATVAILPSPDIAVRMGVPRALVADFPLGRPLGRPLDPALQRSVIQAALALLERPAGPVLETYPLVIEDEADQPLACPVPARFDPDLPEAVDEARGLRAAFTRGGGHGVAGADPKAVEAALFGFAKVAAGVPWQEAGLPADVLAAARDVLSYYEQAAIGLSDHVPAARAAESWYVQQTAAGRTMRAARDQLRSQRAPRYLATYILPATQA